MPLKKLGKIAVITALGTTLVLGSHGRPVHEHPYPWALDTMATRLEMNRVSVRSEAKAPRAYLRTVAREIGLLHPLMSPDQAVHRALISKKMGGGEFAPGNSDKAAYVKLSNKFAYHDTLLAVVSLHEAAHAVFASHEDELGRKLAPLFRKARSMPNARFSGIRGKDAFKREYDPLFGLFDESRYFDFVPISKTAPWGFGHPTDEPDELFASASTVLRHAPLEFMQRMRQTAASDSTRYNLALNIARTVLSAYKGHERRIFSRPLLEYVERPDALSKRTLEPRKQNR